LPKGTDSFFSGPRRPWCFLLRGRAFARRLGTLPATTHPFIDELFLTAGEVRCAKRTGAEEPSIFMSGGGRASKLKAQFSLTGGSRTTAGRPHDLDESRRPWGRKAKAAPRTPVREPHGQAWYIAEAQAELLGAARWQQLRRLSSACAKKAVGALKIVSQKDPSTTASLNGVFRSVILATRARAADEFDLAESQLQPWPGQPAVLRQQLDSRPNGARVLRPRQNNLMLLRAKWRRASAKPACSHEPFPSGFLKRRNSATGHAFMMQRR